MKKLAITPLQSLDFPCFQSLHRPLKPKFSTARCSLSIVESESGRNTLASKTVLLKDRAVSGRSELSFS